MKTTSDKTPARAHRWLAATPWWMAATLATGGLWLGGCNVPLPQAQTDPTKTYVLSGPTSAAPTTPPSAGAPVVRLRPVELPAYLRGRSLIVRRGANEIEARDFARWGEPLEQGIARVLREELLARGAARAVQTGSARGMGGPDAALELTVRIIAAEGRSDGTVAFQAAWELTSISDAAGKEIVGGEYRSPAQLHWTPREESTLAAALSQAVAGLAADVMRGLR